MDIKKFIAPVAIALLFGGYIYYSSTESKRYQEELAAYEAAEAKLKLEQSVEQAAAELVVDTITLEQRAQAESERNTILYGEALAVAKSTPAQKLTLENEVMKVDFTTKGAQVAGVQLKDYTRYAPREERNELIEMFDRENALMDFSFYINNKLNNVQVKTSEYAFTALPIQSVEGGERLTMVLDMGNGSALEFIYTLYNVEDLSRNYMLDFDVKFRNMSPIMVNSSPIFVDWKNTTYQNERSFSTENNYTTVAYHFKDESSIKKLGVSKEEKSKEVDSAVEWIGFKQQFFSSIFIAPTNNFVSADLSYDTAEEGSGYMKSFAAQMELDYDANKEDYKFNLYFGPNKFSTLNAANDLGYGDLELQELVPLGWGIIGWVNRWFVIPVFDFLRNHIASFGIIILILTLLVKLIIFFPTYSSYLSMGKMRVIKPEVDAITSKYPKQEDAVKRQQATMELYKKVGVNPMGGCLPMLLQMPIIIAMFRFFPASIELRGESFLWSHDLSSYDSIAQLPFSLPFYGDHVSLFAILMAVVLFGYSYMNYELSSSSQPQMAGMKFMMVYLMPAMMLLWFNSYSSGLCYYYFLSNLFTIAQTLIIRRMVDDDKIHALLKANAAKSKSNNGKKSKFQLRYEALLAEQEAAKKAKK